MGNDRVPFEPDMFFHVYNHGNAEDIIFREDKNYHFFLKRYRKYLEPIVETYAYCLMPNHFHLLVRIRSKKVLKMFYQDKYPEKDLQSFQNFADLISNQFKNFLISYAKSFNKMYNRRGSLFLDNLNRKPITNNNYYTRLVRYIHLNPVTHGFVDRPQDWQHSSYLSLLSKQVTLLQRSKVLDWFGGRARFIQAHK